MTVAAWTPADAPFQGLGLMRLTDEWWGDPDRDPERLVRTAIDSGVSLLDTAEMYGNEELVGRAVGAVRDRVTLCSKFGVYWGESGRFDDWSIRADPSTVHAAIDGSLKRLGVDHLDLYYLHHRSEDTPIEDTVGAMAELHQAGKIRALGLSNVTREDIIRAHAVHPIAAVQQEWSLGQRDVESLLPTLADLGIALVAHSPLGHGSLGNSGNASFAEPLADVGSRVGASPGQVALAWVHHRGDRSPVTVVPLPGTTSIAHLQANVAASRIELTDSDLTQLESESSH